jgi:hypothetical protein
MSAFRRSSACIFFSRAFSASSSFIRAIIDTSRPPCFARHLQNVAALIPNHRHNSGTDSPDSTRSRSSMTRLSEDFDFFMQNSPLTRKFYF